jgi:transcriptional regulator with XRE-family HTH domain
MLTFSGILSLEAIIACAHFIRHKGSLRRTLLVTQAKLYEYLFNIYSTNILTQSIGVFYNTFEHYFVYLLTQVLNKAFKEATMSPETSSKIGKTVGEKLRAARIAQRFTQSQLASPDFSVSYISAIERGQIHPSLRALEILAGRLGLSSTQLLPNRSQAEDRHGGQFSIPEREDDEMDAILLEANLQIWQGEAGQVVTQLSKISTKRLKRQQQLQHHYLLGWAHFAVAQFQECEYALNEALQIAKELNAHYLTLRILDLLALAYAAMRNYPQAILSHQRCLHLLETSEAHDPFFVAQVYMHMGQHYTHLDNMDQALEMFSKALETTSDYRTPQAIQALNLDISYQHADNKEYDLATQYAYKCLYLNDVENTKHLRSELYHYLGRALLKEATLEIQPFIDESLQDHQVTRDALAQASILTTKAEWCFKQQSSITAADDARRALTLAEPFNDTLIGATAHITLGRIEYTLSHSEQADQHFTAGLSMLERLGRHEELANESVNYAQILEEHGNEREAFTYFRRAFQSRQKMGK